ncbi:unnamed protein product [Macrosiphum euphorbiae]|uniref:Uncharacterized protein n=1 Tax=Macrosiphum euphorbiae TaxID=13131 RepID=A0AAV0WEZ6_9HEMI|nr:unnamed protein product [Macrosiphum euphorbiae]
MSAKPPYVDTVNANITQCYMDYHTKKSQCQPSKPTASTDNDILPPGDNEIQSTVALQMTTTRLYEYSVSSQVLLSNAILYLQDNKGNLH